MGAVLNVVDETVTVNVHTLPEVVVNVQSDEDPVLGGAPYTWGALRYSHVTWGELKSKRWGQLR